MNTDNTERYEDAIERGKEAEQIRLFKEKQLAKTASSFTLLGTFTIAVLAIVVLMFVYYRVLGKNKVVMGAIIFGVAIALIVSIGQNSKKRGGQEWGRLTFV